MSHISGFRAGAAPTRWATAAALFVLTVAMSALPTVTNRANADVKPGGFMSSNVEWVGQLPLDAPGIGARIVKVGDQTRFYVTGSKGLTIWDVSNPALPLLLGTHPLPHWENEDVSVSADGNWVIVSVDGTVVDQSDSISFVINTTNPRLPVLASTFRMGAHISTCADDACNIVYGSDGWTYDLTDKYAPTQVNPGWLQVVNTRLAIMGRAPIRSSVHDLNRDAAGYFTTDSTPRVMFDPRPDPKKPVVLTSGDVPRALNLAYQHNNIRIRADEWQPRISEEDNAEPWLRPGEILLSNGETNFTRACGSGSGPFATWSARDWDKGAPLKPLHVFRPVNGTYADSNPAVNAVGCSGHWFSYRDGLVAAAWYENGTRFLDIDDASGEITEVGFFQPVNGSAFASYWINDEYVYTVDAGRGIDILRFNRSGSQPSESQKAASWNAVTKPHPVAASERFRCDLVQRGA